MLGAMWGPLAKYLVSRCDPHGRFTIVIQGDTGGAAHSCAAGHTTFDNKYPHIIIMIVTQTYSIIATTFIRAVYRPTLRHGAFQLNQ